MSLVRFERVSTWSPAFVRAIRHHYTRSAGAPPGKKIAWSIWEGKVFRGWIGLGEPAYKLAPRRALGIADALSLPHSVCCFIYRLEAEGEVRASTILKRWHEVASKDWHTDYGWRPIHWETMIGVSGEVASAVPGACFRRAGYRALGLTTGRSRRRPEGRSGHGNGCSAIWVDADPKLVLYRGPLPRLPGAHKYMLPERREHQKPVLFEDGQGSLV